MRFKGAVIYLKPNRSQWADFSLLLVTLVWGSTFVIVKWAIEWGLSVLWLRLANSRPAIYDRFQRRFYHRTLRRLCPGFSHHNDTETSKP